ncbi:hypothetical protein [Candidatus Nitrospira nitrificans]
MGSRYKQLVTDEQEHLVAVLISYEEWLRIERQLENGG